MSILFFSLFFSFRLSLCIFFPLFLGLDPDFDRRDYKRPLISRQIQKGGGRYMEFMKAIVSDIGFTIAFID